MEKSRISYDPEVESRCSMRCQRCEKFIKAIDARYGQSHIELDKLHKHVFSTGHPLSGKVFVCSECMAAYQSIQKAKKHVRVHHRLSPTARVLSAVDSGKAWEEMSHCFPECHAVKPDIRQRFLQKLDKMNPEVAYTAPVVKERRRGGGGGGGGGGGKIGAGRSGGSRGLRASDPLEAFFRAVAPDEEVSEVESRCSIQCTRCGKFIKAIDARYGQNHVELDKLHRHIVSAGHPLSGKVFVCSDCPITYQSATKCRKHVATSHFASPTARVLSAVPSDKVWTEMELCFPEASAVKQHIRDRFLQRLDRMK